MHLESISADNYKEFVCNHFEAGKRHVESEIIDKVYNNFEGHTWYLQILFNELYSLTPVGENCTLLMFDEALKNLISLKSLLIGNIIPITREAERNFNRHIQRRKSFCCNIR